MPRLIPLALCALAALAACDRETPQERAARRDAARAACVADELALRAVERLASLDTLLAVQGPNPITESAHAFATAYRRYAEARERQTELMDSAAAVSSREDSARLAAEALSALPRPVPGTVEGNAAQSFERDMAQALANPDHPCNVEPEEN